jgi:hypothetical protein
MRNGLLFTVITLIMLATLPTQRSDGAAPDGATIHNSGSTNTTGFTITLWADGTGNVSMPSGNPRAIAIAHDLIARFFTDLQAAQRENAPPSHCMKSASFGTATVVVWHAWQSPDLQCPPLSASMGALANDVRSIEAAAGVGAGALRRIGLPPSIRKNPPATPEVSPT